MIILQKETTEHREPGTSAPQGEPGPPPSVLTPQSPCTVERAVGVGTLYQDTIYASAATTNESCRSSHQMMYSPVCTPWGGHHSRRVGSASWVRGTSTLPRVLGLRLERKILTNQRQYILTKCVQAIQALASPWGIRVRPVLPRPETLVTFGYRPKLHQDEGISSF